MGVGRTGREEMTRLTVNDALCQSGQAPENQGQACRGWNAGTRIIILINSPTSTLGDKWSRSNNKICEQCQECFGQSM